MRDRREREVCQLRGQPQQKRDSGRGIYQFVVMCERVCERGKSVYSDELDGRGQRE